MEIAPVKWRSQDGLCRQKCWPQNEIVHPRDNPVSDERAMSFSFRTYHLFSFNKIIVSRCMHGLIVDLSLPNKQQLESALWTPCCVTIGKYTDNLCKFEQEPWVSCRMLKSSNTSSCVDVYPVDSRAAISAPVPAPANRITLLQIPASSRHCNEGIVKTNKSSNYMRKINCKKSQTQQTGFRS
jgi:hypothetical protein